MDKKTGEKAKAEVKTVFWKEWKKLYGANICKHKFEEQNHAMNVDWKSLRIQVDNILCKGEAMGFRLWMLHIVFVTYTHIF